MKPSTEPVTQRDLIYGLLNKYEYPKDPLKAEYYRPQELVGDFDTRANRTIINFAHIKGGSSFKVLVSNWYEQLHPQHHGLVSEALHLNGKLLTDLQMRQGLVYGNRPILLLFFKNFFIKWEKCVLKPYPVDAKKSIILTIFKTKGTKWNIEEIYQR